MKIVFATVLLGIGGALIFTGYTTRQDIKATTLARANFIEEIDRAQRAQIDFDIDALLSGDDFRFNKETSEVKDADLVALFLIHSKICAPCLGEVLEYAVLLDSLDQAHPALDIAFVTLVVDTNTVAIERFLTLAPLPGIIGAGYSDAVEQVALFQGRTFFQQLTFVDVERATSFFRVSLSTRSTPLVYKAEVLKTMLTLSSSKPT